MPHPTDMTPAARPSIDRLEARRLLATIEGTIWNDADSDGLFDFFEDPLPGVLVFLDQNQNRLLDDGETTTLTDAQGEYAFDGLAPDDYFVGFVAELEAVEESPGVPARLAQTSPGISGRTNGSFGSGDFDIEIDYIDLGLSDVQRTLFETAVAKWEEAIIGDLPDRDGVDDLRLAVNTARSDGPGGTLASAGPTSFRPASEGGLPLTGVINLDPADLSATRGAIEVAVHEIGHALGIGTVWQDLGLVNGVPGPVPQFVGPRAVEEYGRLFGFTPNSVPVQGFINGEVDPGSSFSHWDEDTFLNELMTPSADGDLFAPVENDPENPLSRMSIASLADLGYEVNLAASETYGPLGIGPLPGDLDDIDDDDFDSLPIVPFELSIRLEADDEVFDRGNFGARFNQDPRPFFFNAGPTFAADGDSVRLLAEIDTLGDPAFDADPFFDGDLDFRDRVRQVNFFRESNGVDGLQTPADVRRGAADSADTLLDQDAIPGDGFETTIEIDGDVGEVVRFYALAYDGGYFTTARTDTITLVGDQDIPAKPTDLRAVGIDTNTFLIEFDDRSTDESGYLLQVAESPDFNVIEETRTIDIGFDDDVLDADEDGEDLDPDDDGVDEVLDLGQREATEPVRFTYELPQVETGENLVRYFRLRSFNTAGSSAFAGPAVATTLSPGAVLIDNSDDDLVDAGDFVERRGAESAVGLTYLAGDGTATFDVGGEEFEAGRFFVFAQTAADADFGQTTIRLFDGDTLVAERVVDEDEAGAEILLGEYRVDGDYSVQFASTGDDGVATADAVRLLPAV